MRKSVMTIVLVMLLILAGCCNNPGIFAKINASQRVVQAAYYTAKGDSKLQSDSYVMLGGLAADTALALAGTLQGQWCPSEAAARQLEEQVKQLPLVK